MGCCLSKKDPCSKSVIKANNIPETQQNDLKIETQKLNNDVTAQIELQRRRVSATVDVEERENKVEEEKKEPAKSVVKKKEVFVIQHRKSNDRRPDSDGSASNSSDPESIGRNLMAAAASGQVVRTSSCTKEEVDAILIQCGRLSRSSSGKGNAGNGSGGHGRRYSGSKRSFDFDRENEGFGNGNGENGNEEGGEEEERLRRRQSRGSNRRRTTPSRSRERVEQRSGSRERISGQSSGRRVSRSPGRRSESPMSQHGNGNGNGNNSVGNGNGNGNGNNSVGNGNGNGIVRPGKLVSVPATVTSLSIDKGNNGNGGDNGNVKRVLVKRNVGSPRSQSPARGNQVNGTGNGNGNGRSQSPGRGNQASGNGNGNGNGNGRAQSPGKGNQASGNGNGQQASLSRNGSRKAEQSPYRRTPLNEIDLNSLPFQPLANKRPPNKGKEIEEDIVTVKQPINCVSQNKYAADTVSGKASLQGTHRRTRSRGAEGYEVMKTNYCRVNDFHTPSVEQMTEEKRDQLNAVEYDAMVTPVILSGTETMKLPQTLVRSRSNRRSRDFDINVDASLTPTPTTNYTSLLLQDIQNFHQNKNSSANSNANSTTKTSPVTSNNSTTAPFTLPPCVNKACSILEAVADLNSTTGPNLSFPVTDERKVSPRSGTEIACKADINFSCNPNKKRLDPFVESEVKVGNDLMQPSLHKYVTVRKRGGDMDDEESSGSNSITGNGQQNWVSSSSWEPNSAESTDCWTSRSYTGEDEFSPIGFQRHAISDLACGVAEDSGRKYSKNGRDLQPAPQQQIGAARSRTGPTVTTSKIAAASM